MSANVKTEGVWVNDGVTPSGIPIQKYIEIKDSGNHKYRQRLLVATPTLGLVRMEWVAARYNQIIPTGQRQT